MTVQEAIVWKDGREVGYDKLNGNDLYATPK
jgi:hypothetical protein